MLCRMIACVGTVLALSLACASPETPLDAAPVPAPTPTPTPGPDPTPGPAGACDEAGIKAWLVAQGKAQAQDSLRDVRCVEGFAAAEIVSGNSDPGTVILKESGGSWELLGQGTGLEGWCKDHQAEIPVPKCRELLRR
jgi:hypothetical protein